MKLKRLLIPLISCLPMYAHAISQEELSSINNKITEFKSILLNADIVSLVDNLPPKIREQTAKFYGYSDVGLRESMIATQQWYRITNQPKTFECDTNQSLEGKTPLRDYVVFPCTATGLTQKKPFITVGYLVAFSDNYQWQIYWMKNADDWQIVKNAYPDFAEDKRFNFKNFRTLN